MLAIVTPPIFKHMKKTLYFFCCGCFMKINECQELLMLLYPLFCTHASI
ncbi:hypothetical protein HanXRQr2_Chr17g0808101 [Helianthus annuus]|uniref:Uncharacterized protein n=1 Tax=Helianthus annuus TaxID=4232 RepID=A0A9K3DI43_HELAN|nr:hypothetical protein HanXRQr2_Chr17g0808101 [Helianthus annuus]KAJ0813615.1 hypothetical protein HanPSC8_Chr17g0775591 [Helianthus annuus]